MKLNKKTIYYLIVFTILFSLSIIVFVNVFVTKILTYSMGNLILIIGGTILFLLNSLPFFRKFWVNDEYEYAIIALVLVTILSIVALTIALVGKIVDSYFNSIYILLGSMLVALVGLFLNRGLEKQKEDKINEKIIYLLYFSVKLNLDTTKNLVNFLNKEPCKQYDLPYETNYLEVISSNILDINLEINTLHKITTIQKLTWDINKLIENRNLRIRDMENDIPQSQTISKVFHYSPRLKKLQEINSSIIKKIYDLSLKTDDALNELQILLDIPPDESEDDLK